MENILKIAKEKFPKNTLFYSATNALKSPCRVSSLKMAENYANTVVDSNWGVVYDGINKVWAKKV